MLKKKPPKPPQKNQIKNKNKQTNKNSRPVSNLGSHENPVLSPAFRVPLLNPWPTSLSPVTGRLTSTMSTKSYNWRPPVSTSSLWSVTRWIWRRVGWCHTTAQSPLYRMIKQREHSAYPKTIVVSFILIRLPFCLYPLRWRHNDHAGVSNDQPQCCLLNRLFRHKSKETSKLRVTGLCAGNSPGTGEFPAQMASYAENVSIWWRHHAIWENVKLYLHFLSFPMTEMVKMAVLHFCVSESGQHSPYWVF